MNRLTDRPSKYSGNCDHMLSPLRVLISCEMDRQLLLHFSRSLGLQNRDRVNIPALFTGKSESGNDFRLPSSMETTTKAWE